MQYDTLRKDKSHCLHRAACLDVWHSQTCGDTNQSPPTITARLTCKVVSILYLLCPLSLRKTMSIRPPFIAFPIFILWIVFASIDGFSPVRMRRSILSEQRVVFALHFFTMRLPLLTNSGIGRFGKTLVPRLFPGHSARILVALYTTRSAFMVWIVEKFVQIALPYLAAFCGAFRIVATNINTFVGNVDVGSTVTANPLWWFSIALYSELRKIGEYHARSTRQCQSADASAYSFCFDTVWTCRFSLILLLFNVLLYRFFWDMTYWLTLTYSHD